jgi:hypothetical protein
LAPSSQLKMSPSKATARKGGVEDNDRENSRIPRSSFSKGHKSKVVRRVSFESEDLQRKQQDSPSSSINNSSNDDKPSRRSISFNKRVRIRKIRTLEEMPKEEIANTYFSEQDLVGIRNKLRIRIRSLVESNFQEELHDETIDDSDNESSFCIRGLEHEFPKGKGRRKQLKMMARGGVLEEQRLQKEFFVHSDRSSSTHDTNDTSASSISTHNTVSASNNSRTSCFSLISQQEDPSVAIAEIYRIESKPAVHLALEFARRDQFVADQIYFAHQAI